MSQNDHLILMDTLLVLHPIELTIKGTKNSDAGFLTIYGIDTSKAFRFRNVASVSLFTHSESFRFFLKKKEALTLKLQV